MRHPLDGAWALGGPVGAGEGGAVVRGFRCEGHLDADPLGLAGEDLQVGGEDGGALGDGEVGEAQAGEAGGGGGAGSEPEGVEGGFKGAAVLVDIIGEVGYLKGDRC